MLTLLSTARRIQRAEALLGPEPPAIADGSAWDWFAEGCPCGRPAGECTIHPRARAAQRPPAGDWRTWLLLGGRAAGKTRAAAELVRHWVESGQARRIGLVAPTAADYRDTMIQGPSGLLAIAPPWDRPKFEPSKRRLTWPNGAVAICLSADRPERTRGLQFDRLWCDELCAWHDPQRMWETMLLCLRLGTQPKAVVTTTPRPIKLLARILHDPTTRLSKETTFANARHLAAEFISEITTMYEGTRLGQQELFAEVLDTSATVRFPGFSPARHVVERAEYVPGLPVRLAIDCGLSRHVGALFFQVRERDGTTPGGVRRIISVFADYYAVDKTSYDNALAILERSRRVCGGRIDRVYLDPASTAKSGIGPAAWGEFARILGERLTGCWPSHRVLEGLDQVEILLAAPPREPDLWIHPRCQFLIESFQTYRRAESRGEVLDAPADPQHPAEEAIDALRGAVRTVFPESRIEPPTVFHRVPY
jgi:Terminase large subunit, T4likevirus-type, N-terminal